MKIKVLGSRGEVASSSAGRSLHSGILIDDSVLLDIGEEKFLERRPKAVFISHLHSDHAFFIRPSGRKNVFEPKVFSPETAPGVELIHSPIVVGKLIVRPIPTVHSARVKSFGYLVSTGKKNIFYTGDIVRVKPGFSRLLKNIDLVIADGSFMRKGGFVKKNKAGRLYGHAGIPDLVNFFKPRTRRMLFVHFGGWFHKHPLRAEKKIAALAEKTGMKIVAGRDGFETTV